MSAASSSSSWGASGAADEPGSQPQPSLAALTGMTPTALREAALNRARAAPITALHFAAGTTVTLAGLVGLLPTRALLFHPRLAFAPLWQLHRVPSSLLVFGGSPLDLARAAGNMLYWQAPLETLLGGSGDVYRDGRLVRRGENRRRRRRRSKQQGQDQGTAGGDRNSLLEWLVLENRFLHTQLVAAAAIAAMELLLRPDPRPFLLNSGGEESPSVLIVFPYSLFPVLEQANRWLWALTDAQDRDVLLLGMVPVRPVYVPLAMALTSGPAGWLASLKGLAAALLAARALGLRRGNSPDDDLVVDYAARLANSWRRWLIAVGSRLLGGRGAAPSAPAAAAQRRQQRPAATRPTDFPDLDAEAPALLGGVLDAVPAQLRPFLDSARVALTGSLNQLAHLDGSAPPAASDGGVRGPGAAARGRHSGPTIRELDNDGAEGASGLGGYTLN
ncbi:hypothetical protein HK405_015985 [Cladochytrium tenue]|nr:hypothetical protein HK405_015985 [Cladochytrium tenue]